MSSATALYMNDFSATLTPVTAISPVDGRYRNRTKHLANRFSEAAWMRSRVHVEAEYLIALSDEGVVRSLADGEKAFLKGLYKDFSLPDAEEVKKTEATRAKRHDIKAIEYWIGDRFANTSLSDLKPKIHFGLTSEDVDNIAITYLLKYSIAADYLPPVLRAAESLYSLAERHKKLPMLGRTHGKPGAATTVGKEIVVYVTRVQEAAEKIAAARLELPGKMNGPVGTFDPLTTTYPDHDWMKFSEKFVAKFGLSPYGATTQILPHDRISRLFREIVGMNDILEDMSQNFWRYASDDWFKLVAGDRGISSVMAHKRNPEEFETAEGNLQTSTALLAFMASKLQKSRLQRDLSGSTVRRNYGVALAHALLGYGNAQDGLNVMNVDEVKILLDLDAHPEILSTDMQTILRSVGQEGAYEKLQELTRGRPVAQTEMAAFVDELDVGGGVKERLKSLSVRDSARAEAIVDSDLAKARIVLDELKAELAIV